MADVVRYFTPSRRVFIPSMAIRLNYKTFTLESLAFAWAVDNRISVSSALAVTGCVLATSEFSKSWDLNLAYSSPIISHASSVNKGFMHLAISRYFFTNSGAKSLSFDLVCPTPPAVVSHIGVSF